LAGKTKSEVESLDPFVVAQIPAIAPQVPQLGNGPLPAGEVGGVDKIRELLFGSQIQDYDRRFSKLEERFLQRVKDIEAETTRNLGAFEMHAKKQMDSLAGQLREEKEQRAEAEKDIDRAVREHGQSVDRRLRAISDQLAQFERELSDRLSQESHSLREEIRRKNEEVQQTIETVFSALSNVKTDRNLLAGLFVEVAKCLKHDAAVKGGGNAGNELPRGWPAT
jgi:hypothetical protein